ncbi:MAG: class I SAM-dependent methyltransferase [Actinomycetia bacterium]|nr:class I SAM-dependent methyltransferase [Actinomycetes bacterium]
MEPIDCPLCGASGAETVWHEDGYDLVRCGTCDLVYVGNPPDEAEIAQLYSFDGGFHTQLADDSDSASSATDANARHHLDVIEATQSPGRLLDVGCATGRFLDVARKRGWTVEGVELNDDTAEIARGSGLSVTTGTLDSLDAGAAFDAITMWDVIEHVPDPLSLLRDAHRLLAPGGRLWLATPNVDGLFPTAALKVAPRVGKWPHPEPPYHLCQFSERTLRQALGRAGFGRVDVTHERIPLGYTFGSRQQLLSQPKRLAYSAVFAPLALAGPKIRRGDTMIVSARA